MQDSLQRLRVQVSILHRQDGSILSEGESQADLVDLLLFRYSKFLSNAIQGMTNDKLEALQLLYTLFMHFSVDHLTL